MRSVVFEFVREHPYFALNRPLTFIRAMNEFGNTDLSTVPTAAFITGLIMYIGIGLAKRGSLPEQHSIVLRFPILCGVLALCFLVSLDSVFIIYSADFLISDQAYLSVMMLVVLLIWSLDSLFSLIGGHITASRAMRR